MIGREHIHLIEGTVAKLGGRKEFASKAVQVYHTLRMPANAQVHRRRAIKLKEMENHRCAASASPTTPSLRLVRRWYWRPRAEPLPKRDDRSEEHTSEL